uniref:Uncharacterized protein n=1 Tax=Globisporangium ultimum (strain ATCC 200006 / CBS 805.95 / DAOM BR144) TaxID=431595 RepID=K3W5N4_GLOUD
MAATSLSGLRSALSGTATSVSPMPALALPTPVAPLEFVMPFCTNAELARVSLLDREHERICEHEWRLRVLRRYGALRYDTRAWRKCFKLRAHLEQKAVDAVTARVYLMNGRGETQCFTLPRGKSLMCSRERAVVYNRCERMFDLSLRINRSIQEISALIGMISVDEARGLLNEHINLMASVASLRGSLLFESELFQVFPAPVLLDANSLLRGTFSFPDASFLQSSTLMMQVWASIDGLIYRPLSSPVVIEHCVDVIEEDGEDNRAAGAQVEATDGNAAAEAAVTASEYHSVKLHDLSGMTIHIDDNTLRYKLQKNEICINALVSNTYLLYLFNPLNFRPLDWTFEAVVHVDATRYVLPVQREGVFLNTTSFALRVFLSYGKIPEKEQQQDDDENGANTKGGSRSRGAETSEPLEIPYTCGVSIDDNQILSFCLTATNRVTKETREIASKSACISVTSSPEEEDAAPVAPTESVGPPASDEAQVEMASEKENAMQVDDRDEDQDPGNMDTRTSLASPRTTTATKTPVGPTERHVHLPRVDAMICYSFSPSRHLLQYVEFAIGFEPLMHQLGVSSFLPDVVPVSA